MLAGVSTSSTVAVVWPFARLRWARPAVSAAYCAAFKVRPDAPVRTMALTWASALRASKLAVISAAVSTTRRATGEPSLLCRRAMAAASAMTCAAVRVSGWLSVTVIVVRLGSVSRASRLAAICKASAVKVAMVLAATRTPPAPSPVTTAAVAVGLAKVRL